MREKSLKVQNWLSAIVFLGGLALIFTTYKGIFIPSPWLSLNLGLLALGLYGIHMYRKEPNKKKEILLLFTVSVYANLIISAFIYSIWSFEKIFTKQGITQMSIFVFMVLSIYLCVAYIRARITYKQVKGNQRHNEAWHVSKKEVERMKNSDDIYINLGVYYEKNVD